MRRYERDLMKSSLELIGELQDLVSECFVELGYFKTNQSASWYLDDCIDVFHMNGCMQGLEWMKKDLGVDKNEKQ